MRRRFLVSYDISNAKRLRRIFKTMKDYGDALQYSVFLCDLTPQEKVVMLAELTSIFHETEDRFFVVDLGPVRERGAERIEFFGRQPEDIDFGEAVVV